MADIEQTGFMTLVGWIISIAFILTIFTSAYLISMVAINDYVVYDLQVFIEDYREKGMFTDDTVDLSDAIGDNFQQWIYNADRIFILMFVLFVVEAFIFAYYVKQINLFNFFAFLFYGVMVVMFILSVILTLSKWFLNDFLIKLIPQALTILPAYSWFLSHAGMVLFVILVLCMLINRLDLDLVRDSIRKRKEQSLLDTKEI